MSFAKEWMNLEHNPLSEIRQAQKTKYHMITLMEQNKVEAKDMETKIISATNQGSGVGIINQED